MTVNAMMKELVALGQSSLDLHELLRQCLSLRFHLGTRDAEARLSKYERTVLAYLMLQIPEVPAGQHMAVVFRPHGQCRLVTMDHYLTHHAQYQLVRSFCIPERIHAEALNQSAFETQQWTRQLEQWRQRHDDTTLKAFALQLADGVEHMAPLVLHLEEYCFSNFYYVGTSGHPWECTLADVFAEVATHGYAASLPRVMAVMGLHVLWSAGGYTRLEEFNSCQLSPMTLKAWLVQRFGEYQAILGLGEQEFDAFLMADHFEQAQVLARLRKQLTEQGQFVRDIHGLSLHKKERFVPHSLANDELRRITQQAQSHALIEQCLGVDISVHEFFSRHTAHDLIHNNRLRGDDERFSSDLEYLIDALLTKVVEITESDIVMTRGIRSFANFAALWSEGRFGELCNWTQADYFCHVVPSAALQQQVGHKALLSVLNAVSARMRYNSWHYMPSHVPAANIPDGRSWFFAPRMADTTVWSDFHHAGHVHAAVRYCIRSPHAIRLGDHSLPGFVDLRLMRQNGKPYQSRELGTALAYTEALGLVYQRLMDHLVQSGEQFAFEFGSKAWIDQRGLVPGLAKMAVQP